MEPPPATRVMIISDLHLGGVAPYMMSQPQHLAAYLAWLTTITAADETLELVIAGDVIDFLAIPAYASWTPDPQQACAKLRQTLEGPFARCSRRWPGIWRPDHRHRLRFCSAITIWNWACPRCKRCCCRPSAGDATR